MVHYEISAKIHYDEKRTNGRYYADVMVITREEPHSDPLQTKNIEVILNGDGINKARAKITRQLAWSGITLAKMGPPLRIGYDRPKTAAKEEPKTPEPAYQSPESKTKKVRPRRKVFGM